MLSHLALLGLLGLVPAEFPASDVRSATAASRPAPGDLPAETRAQSENFQIECPATGTNPRELAVHCERVRRDLYRSWFGLASPAAAGVKCQIVLHASPADYRRAVGSEAGHTAGATSMGSMDGRIVSRRIDLCATPAGAVPDALPHELTHVIISEHFGCRRLPAWIEEGMAVLADSPEKQDLHRRDLALAHGRNEVLPLTRLETCPCCAAGCRRAVFYGQSLALDEYLVRRAGRQALGRFAADASQYGVDVALARVYGLNGLDALNRSWRAQLAAQLRLQLAAQLPLADPGSQWSAVAPSDDPSIPAPVIPTGLVQSAGR